MPLLITPTTAFETPQGFELPRAYAVIRLFDYDADQQYVRCAVSFYPSQQACADKRTPVQLLNVPNGYGREATTQEVSAGPIIPLLEQCITAKLQELLGEGATIEAVA